MNSYPFRFIQSFPQTHNDFLVTSSLYSFKSTKSNQTYWVWIEEYDDEVYIIKFHLKNHRNSNKKYEILTGLNEPRSIILTCLDILKGVVSHHPDASFGFIGASAEGEDAFNNKRFKFYLKMINTYLNPQQYSQFNIFAKSACVLIPKSKLLQEPDFPKLLNERFREMYPYFDL